MSQGLLQLAPGEAGPGINAGGRGLKEPCGFGRTVSGPDAWGAIEVTGVDVGLRAQRSHRSHPPYVVTFKTARAG
jgi:hypothetical protein